MVSCFRILLLVACLLTVAAPPALAGSRDFRLAAPADLVDSGFLKHLLPRFSLKMQTRITLVSPGQAADAALGTGGRGTPVFNGLGRQWRIETKTPDHPGISRFITWIGGEIGLRTIAGFAPGNGVVFTAPQKEQARKVALALDGDPAQGLIVSQRHCKRCHTVTPEDRMSAIGSTPSFFVLRTLPDWSDRFEQFYALNPHPAFTQVAEVTPPFAHDRPSPIVPVEITLDELEAIVAYVAGLTPADLGAPIKHQ